MKPSEYRACLPMLGCAARLSNLEVTIALVNEARAFTLLRAAHAYETATNAAWDTKKRGLFALRERAPGAAETVLVLGASGGVGRGALQLGRAMGARVLAGSCAPKRLVEFYGYFPKNGTVIVLGSTASPTTNRTTTAHCWKRSTAS